MKKFVFLCNFLNHHQLEFCESMVELTGNNFYFVATEKVPQSFLDFGYENMNEMYDFVIKMYDDREKAISVIENADVLIIGTNSYMDFKSPKLRNLKSDIFIYSERYFKENSILHKIKNFIFAKKYLLPLSKIPNLHFLCASAYLIEDCNKWVNFNDVFYRWGYFPPCVVEDDIQNVWANKKEKTILWCARFIELKHPEEAIDLIAKLVSIDSEYKLIMVGDGYLFEKTKEYCKSLGMENNVQFTGSVKASEVREYMKKSQFFLMGSGRNEGWGAVINESLNSGCVVMAKKEMGCAPFLIKNGVNGFTYTSLDECVDIITKTSSEQLNKISNEAYKTIVEEWNAKTAASRLIDLSNDFSKEYKSGPCSLMRYKK